LITLKSNFALFLFFISILLLAACGNSAGANSSGSATTNNTTPSGSELLFIQKGCIACHTVEEGTTSSEAAASQQAANPEQIGPSMVGVATRSLETIKHPDYTGSADTVEVYLKESILKPEIYVVPDYEPLMPPTYSETINEQELTELVNYMLTFK
jgi:cytochrome c551/c552